MTKNEVVTKLVLALIEKDFIQSDSREDALGLAKSVAAVTAAAYNLIYDEIKAVDEET